MTRNLRVALWPYDPAIGDLGAVEHAMVERLRPPLNAGAYVSPRVREARVGMIYEARQKALMARADLRA
jgi:hypothetical protein